MPKMSWRWVNVLIHDKHNCRWIEEYSCMSKLGKILRIKVNDGHANQLAEMFPIPIVFEYIGIINELMNLP